MSTRRVWLLALSSAIMVATACAPRYTSRVEEPDGPTAIPPQEAERIIQSANRSYETGVEFFVKDEFDSAAVHLEQAISLLSQDLDWSTYEGILSERRLLLYKCRYFRERLPIVAAEIPRGTDIDGILPRKPQLPPIEIVQNSKVEKWIRYFCGNGRETFNVWVKRSGKYRDATLRTLREEGVPLELVNLALIESGFNPNAYSRAHAVGLWQFIKSTGEVYGLRVDWWVDERRDPERSTRAAARHLRDLHEALDSWPLALAAYNWGQRNVEKAMKRAHTRDYWKLRTNNETRDYVPKFMAACLIMSDPRDYGFSLTFDDPVEHEEIEVEPKTDLQAIAKCCEVPHAVIKDLNPHLIRGCAPDGDSFYPVRIPRGKLEVCRAELLKLPLDQRIAKSFESPTVKHRVRHGENLSKIAKAYGVRVDDIVRANRIRDRNRIRIGQVLTIPGGTYKVSIDNPGIHVVRKSETLSSIAQRYGVKIGDLERWNGLKSRNLIYAGQHLIVSPDRVKDQPGLTHIVRSGETLSGIAEKYELSLQEIVKVNRIGSADRIYPNQKLTIPGVVSGIPGDQVVVYKVKKGDTVTGIAVKYSASLEAILSLNGLKRDATIYEGQDLLVPVAPGSEEAIVVHEVRQGETIWSIAREYATSWKDVLLTNNLGSDDPIHPGQKIKIDLTKSNGVTVHTVRPGDTISHISRKYRTTVEAILRLNGLDPKTTIYPGQKIKILLR